MDSGLPELLKNAENELLELKTSKSFLGVRTAKFTSIQAVTSGRYRVSYAAATDLISAFYTKNDTSSYVYSKTPVGNHQDIEVELSIASDTLEIISTQPVISVDPL